MLDSEFHPKEMFAKIYIYVLYIFVSHELSKDMFSQAVEIKKV